jgi:hypothetical protein
LGDPRYTDKHRYPLGYVPSSEMGEGYLQRRFKEIAERQKQDAAARLKNVIANRRFK